MSETRTLDVSIMGRGYRIACPVGQEEALREAVTLVERKMTDTASRSRSNMPERVAVLAAVNIASDYLELATGKGGAAARPDTKSSTQNEFSACDGEEIRRRIERMDARLDALLIKN